MRFASTLKLLGSLLMLFSLSMLPPIFVALWYHDGGLVGFTAAFFITLLLGGFLFFTFYRHRQEVSVRDGFMVVTLFWVVLSFFGALPFIISIYPKISFTDCIFETVSGLTTTGASVFAHLRTLSHAMLYYRLQLHFLGGMGIIVLAVAVLPMLGVGGMQLYRAEMAGPVKTTKLTPRIGSTAKALWYIYVGMAVCCIMAYWAAGMPLFDAVGEGFSTVATGGFSMHDESFAYYHNYAIDCVAIIFMLLGATNFSLHFHFLRDHHFSTYWKDSELRTYLTIIATVAVIVLFTLFLNHYYHWARNLMNSLFIVVSMSSTTGFTTTNFSIWPSFLPYLIMFVALVGGCSGSTSGGLKVIRCLLLKEQGLREVRRLLHPKAILPLRLGRQVLPEETIQAIWAFVAAFILIFIILILILLATGLDFTTAYGALAACISNTGASIGKVATNFKDINSTSKWVCIFAMLLGRLEIFTVMVLFTPSYWRR